MTRHVVDTDAVCAPLEGGAVVLHMGTKRYYSLNETATVVWQLLERGTSEGDAVTQLLAAYEVDAPVARAAVAQLVADLVSEGLVAELRE